VFSFKVNRCEKEWFILGDFFNRNEGTKKKNIIFVFNIKSINYREIGEYFSSKKVLTE